MKTLKVAILFILALIIITVIMLMWRFYDESHGLEVISIPVPTATAQRMFDIIEVMRDIEDELMLFTDDELFPGIVSDAQNVHDTDVNRTIKQSIDILAEKYDKSNSQLNNVGYYVSYCRSPDDRLVTMLDFRTSIRKFELETDPVSYFGLTPIEAINLAWLRANDEQNGKNHSNIKEAILYAILDPTHVCSHGMVSAVIGSLSGVDQMGGLPEIISLRITRAMVSDTAGVKYKEILTDIAQNSEDQNLRNAATEYLAPSDAYTNDQKNDSEQELKQIVGSRLHHELYNIYGDKYDQFKSDINAMIAMS